MNYNNVKPKREKYFYTVLFLNDYFPRKPLAAVPETKYFDIQKDTNNTFVKWKECTHHLETEESKYKDLYEEYNIEPEELPVNGDDKHCHLWIRHNLKYPITLEMWDDKGKPIFYCPILKDDTQSLSVGEIIIEKNNGLIIDFTHIKKPEGNQTYKLGMRSLPLFNLEQQSFHLPPLPLDEIIANQTGLAIVFRRKSVDALFDLITEFDESYWHSLETSFDLQYLTQESCYKNCYFSTKFTNDLQEVLDMIDMNNYKIQYSWENPRLNQYENPRYV